MKTMIIPVPRGLLPGTILPCVGVSVNDIFCELGVTVYPKRDSAEPG